MNRITSHDTDSMLSSSLSSTTSYDYMGEERKSLMSEKIREVNPFSTTRDKVSFYEKSMGTPFAGMTMDKMKSFLTRNKTNYRRRIT